ncbi:MAG: LuxR C-terminal-related transcriptional regulator, partial [Zavarzinia sp.]|nr:LuxR C-terminal-related transcriptional regulator [Zavarzinia sp.]
VLRTLPAAMRDFLLSICPLDRFSASLAEAVSLRPDARVLFEEMKERNLFVAPLDRGGHQVRLHSMFREFLVRQASRQGDGPLFESLRRAAEWHRDRGEWIDAIDYAFRARQDELAAHWLEEGAEELLTRQGETARFLSCAERLPPALRARPALAYWMIWAALFSGAHDRAAGLLAEHMEGLERQEGFGVQVGLLRFLTTYFSHRYVDAMTLGRQWLASDPPGLAFDRATVAVAMALCHRTQLDMQGARKAFEVSHQLIAEVASDYGAAWVAALTALFFLLTGRPVAARDVIQDALRRLEPGELMRGSAELVLAEAYYEMNELDQARQLVARSLSTVAQHGNIDVALSGWMVAARLTLLDKGPQAALDLLRQVQALGVRRFGSPIVLQIQCLREEIILDLNYDVRRGLDIGEAEGKAEAEGDQPPSPEIAENLKLLTAYRSIVSGNPRRAVAEIMPVLTATRSGGRLRRWVLASCIKAAAHHAAGETTFALRALMEAVEVCAPLGLRRCLLDHAAIVRPLASALAHHVKTMRDSLDPGAAALAFALAGGAHEDVVPGEEASEEGTGAGAKLSRKEYKVLAMVSQGMTNQQITERLFVSLPTVKWHLRNIYDKLEVRTRTAAVAKARSMGMLQ